MLQHGVMKLVKEQTSKTCIKLNGYMKSPHDISKILFISHVMPVKLLVEYKLVVSWRHWRNLLTPQDFKPNWRRCVVRQYSPRYLFTCANYTQLPSVWYPIIHAFQCISTCFLHTNYLKSKHSQSLSDSFKGCSNAWWYSYCLMAQ